MLNEVLKLVNKKPGYKRINSSAKLSAKEKNTKNRTWQTLYGKKGHRVWNNGKLKSWEIVANFKFKPLLRVGPCERGQRVEQVPGSARLRLHPYLRHRGLTEGTGWPVKHDRVFLVPWKKTHFQCTNVQWRKSHFIQGTRKTRPC